MFLSSLPITPAIRKRARTGRLPLPPVVTQLTAAEQPELSLVDLFVDRLAELPASEWLAIGRNLMATASAPSPRALAFAKVEATLTAERLGVPAWYARDAVETSAFLASKGVARWTPGQRRAFAAAQAAAEDAALALLTHERSLPDDVAVLLAPFTNVLSLSELPARSA